MKIRAQIEYAAVSGLLALCRHVPECWVYGLFRVVGILSYLLLGRRRKTALMNTAVVFPDMTQNERKRIVWRHFLNISESLALNTLIMSGRISNDRLMDMIETDQWEKMENILANSRHRVLLFSAHIGNWEIMSFYSAMRMNKPFHVVARKTNNPLLEQRVMLPMRERFGISVFYKKNALMRIVQATRKGEPAGILVDQRLNPPEGISNLFFGHPAGTTATPALLQIRFGILAVPVYMVKIGKRRYRMIIDNPVDWKNNGKPMEDQVAELTALHQKSIEEIIRQYPEQWFWVHDRWGLWKQRKQK